MESGRRESVRVGEQTFEFVLCRKAEAMGGVPVDHWWMKVTELYRQRQRRRTRPDNHEAVVDCFWALCRQAGSDTEADVQQSYLLARLLPLTRSQGSRRIVADAWLAPASQARSEDRLRQVQDLDEMLRGSRQQALDRVAFRDRTADVLGPPALTEEAVAEYLACCEELLVPACRGLAQDESDVLQQLRQQWRARMQTVGRRGGRALQKQILDVLSYESRAALHRCYSAAWSELLPRLQSKYHFTEATRRFLSLWHLEQCCEAAEGDDFYFHLFHGHVFALHPASGEFLRTATGRELIGDWLARPEEESAFGRLLHGLYVAACHYAVRRDEQAQQRSKQPDCIGDRLDALPDTCAE